MGTTPMFVYGVNDRGYAGEAIISVASCTTNCIAPFLAAADKIAGGIRDGSFITVHASTASQSIVDEGESPFRVAPWNAAPCRAVSRRAAETVCPSGRQASRRAAQSPACVHSRPPTLPSPTHSPTHPPIALHPPSPRQEAHEPFHLQQHYPAHHRRLQDSRLALSGAQRQDQGHLDPRADQQRVDGRPQPSLQ